MGALNNNRTGTHKGCPYEFNGMNDQKNHPRRKSTRLPNYDYSESGYYFVTICTQNKTCFFGQIVEESVKLNKAGKPIDQCWLEIPNRFPTAKLHQHIIMPNHLHGIIELVGASLVDAHSRHKGQPQGIAPTLGGIVGAFKSISTNAYIIGVKQKGWKPFNHKLWQRNYYEHVIRNEDSFREISEYIQNNPLKWQDDKYYIP